MAMEPPLSENTLAALRRLDTCTVANAIETFSVRLRNAGFAESRIRCMFGDWPPLVGYAATARMRSGEPPVLGGAYRDRTALWRSILQVPPPRIVVFEDLDVPPGIGAFLGDVHASILMALGCVGYVTNGAVREVPQVHELGLQLFAGNVAVSHAYAHVFDLGATVRLGGMEVQQGDLLHGDQHGLLSVPKAIAPEIPAVAGALHERDQKIIDLCRSDEFSLEKLQSVIGDACK
ncbi:MAG: RraA family protein [Terriglobales bacterium]|jgi:regulator of RNase E activity RraA